MSSNPRDLDPSEAVEGIYTHLAATEQMPLEESANRWIGEAQAVAEDLVAHDATDAVIHDRTSKIVDLLESIDDTGDADAEARVEAALVLARELVERLE
jgi:hypothetical protein